MLREEATVAVLAAKADDVRDRADRKDQVASVLSLSLTQRLSISVVLPVLRLVDVALVSAWQWSPVTRKAELV
jgi:hypothetical protein